MLKCSCGTEVKRWKKWKGFVGCPNCVKKWDQDYRQGTTPIMTFVGTRKKEEGTL